MFPKSPLIVTPNPLVRDYLHACGSVGEGAEGAVEVMVVVCEGKRRLEPKDEH